MTPGWRAAPSSFPTAAPAFGPEPLRRLLDLGSAGWQPVTVTADGLEIAATCTVAEFYALPDKLAEEGAGTEDWPGLDLIRPCCDSFVASFKVWNMSTVGGNLCTSLPAGPMISLCAGLDGTATVLGPGGSRRELPVADFITGDGQNALAPGELLRSVSLPASALSSRVAFRRLSLSNLGRSAVLLIGRLDGGGQFTLTVTAATKRPVQLRFGSLPEAPELASELEAAIPAGLYHDDIHGLPGWRRDMTHRLAEEIRAELGMPAGAPAEVSGDFWPPQPAQPPQQTQTQTKRGA